MPPAGEPQEAEEDPIAAVEAAQAEPPTAGTKQYISASHHDQMFGSIFIPNQ